MNRQALTVRMRVASCDTRIPVSLALPAVPENPLLMRRGVWIYDRMLHVN
jgi:hypothetical protein